MTNRDRKSIMHGIALASGVLLAMSSPVAGQSSPDVDARIAAYLSCPPRGVVWLPPLEPEDIGRPVTAQFYDQNEPNPNSESDLRAPDVWEQPHSATLHHRALRDRVGRATPETGLQVRAFRDFSHHGGHFLNSLIAQRDAEGLWQVDQINEYLAVSSGGPLPPVEISEWPLSVAESHRLAVLMADSCLDAEPLQSSRHNFAISGASDRVTFEVMGRDPPLVFRRYAEGFGRSQEMLQIIYSARTAQPSRAQ